MMKKMLLPIVLMIVLLNLKAQPKEKSLQQFFKEAGIKPTKVMLAGTFHFAYQNLDKHQTEKKNQRDILSEESQAGLQRVLDVFRAYQPTRIYLESTDAHWLDSCYRVCTDSTFATQRNERVQIGFRLAREMNLQKVYAVDAGTLIEDWNNADSVLLEKVLGSDRLTDKQHANLVNSIYSKFYTYTDSVCANAPLLEAFLLLNEPRNLQLNHGVYLTGYFSTQSNYGPDFLATWWIDRNLRIFNNILLTKPTGEDRILVLFGAGHVPLLKQSFESSPDFEYVDFYKAALELAENIKKKSTSK